MYVQLGLGTPLDSRWIIAKDILTITRLDIQEAAGSLQLCASQISGIEAAVHAVDSLFQQEETGPFCWWMSAMRLTAYIVSLLFITSVDCVHHLLQPSSTPAGCQLNCLSLVMCYIPVKVPPKYALATIPLVKKLYCHLGDVSRVWYADDASAVGKIDRLHEWWSQLVSQGPKFSYFPNAIKTWLVTKEKHHATATTFLPSQVSK